MKILKHGKYYREDNIIECMCGCKYEYESKDIKKDSSVALTTNPMQISLYVACPECYNRFYLGSEYYG